jgi:hypothetical protein
MLEICPMKQTVRNEQFDSPPAKGEYPKGEGVLLRTVVWYERAKGNHPALRAPLLGRRGVGGVRVLVVKPYVMTTEMGMFASLV